MSRLKSNYSKIEAEHREVLCLYYIYEQIRKIDCAISGDL